MKTKLSSTIALRPKVVSSQPAIYLDYNATTPLLAVAREAMIAAMDHVGNPSSIHGAGRHVRKHIERAREQIAALIHCDPTHIAFTSGATEANNWAILGSAAKRVLVSAIEHPSVIEAAVQHTIIPVTHDGVVDLDALAALLQQDTMPTLVCVMWVNNETGVIQPIADIAALCAQHGAALHVDAVQAAGRLPIDLRTLNITTLALSAHKIGGPAGVGALVYNHDVTLNKLLHGGGQERRRRAGTENAIGIIGFGAAALYADQHRDFFKQLTYWRDDLETRITHAMPDVIIAGQNAPRVGNTSQIILPHVAAETQLMALDLAGIAVSSGAACSSGSIKPSPVLLGMGYDATLAGCALRVSMGHDTTEHDIDRFFAAWVTNAQRLIRT